MTTVSIPMTILAAVAPFMAKKDVRFYLNGALLETTGACLRAVGTDGHAMAVADAPSADTLPAPLILPRDAVEWALKQKADAVKLTEADGMYRLAAGGSSIEVKPIDGRYPDYRAVFPRLGDDESMSAFNPLILATIEKARTGIAKVGGAGRHVALTLHGNGKGNSIGFELSGLLAGLRVVGVAMPLRDMKVSRESFTV